MTDARKSDLLLILVTLLAAISWIFSKEAILLMPPLLFMAARFLCAGLILALVAIRPLQQLSVDQVFRSLRVGLVFGIGMSLWVMGLVHINSMGEGAFLTSLGVVMVPVIARLCFQEAQPASTWLAIPIAIAGLALLSLKNGFRPEAGQLFFIAAATIFAFYFTLNTRAANQRTIINKHGQSIEQQKVPALPLTTLALSSVGLVSLAASIALEPWSGLDQAPLAELSAWVLASAVLGTAGRFLLQTYAQALSVHSHGVVILILEPVWVAILAALWFGESMSALQLGGCSLILAALLVNRWTLVSRAIKARRGRKKSARPA